MNDIKFAAELSRRFADALMGLDDLDEIEQWILDKFRKMHARIAAADALTDPILDATRDHIGTHYADCWRHHVACLAYATHRALHPEEDAP